jgi:NADPH:quinone reductase-like Zn-dependent oxidoreductase
MKRIQYRRYGGPEEMRLEAFALPAPGKDEIVVRVEAASVNPVDWKMRQAAMKFMVRAPFPRAMGTDFSGVVESVGAGVTRFRAGDEVVAYPRAEPLPGASPIRGRDMTRGQRCSEGARIRRRDGCPTQITSDFIIARQLG